MHAIDIILNNTQQSFQFTHMTLALYEFPKDKKKRSENGKTAKKLFVIDHFVAQCMPSINQFNPFHTQFVENR